MKKFFLSLFLSVSLLNSGCSPANVHAAGLRILSPLKGVNAAWLPTTKSGLKLWMDLTQETGFANNDPMSTLKDWSGNYVNCTATTTTRPLYQTAITNGKPAALFDGTDDFFTCAATIPTNLATNHVMCVMIVARYNSKGAGSQFGVPFTFKTGTVATSGTINKQFAVSFVENNVGTFGNFWFSFNDSSAANGIANTGTWVGAWHAGVISYAGSSPSSSSSYTLYQDGSSLTIASGGSSSSAFNASFFGKWDSGTLPYKGYIGEVAYWDTACDSTDESNIHTYSTNKWGTP